MSIFDFFKDKEFTNSLSDLDDLISSMPYDSRSSTPTDSSVIDTLTSNVDEKEQFDPDELSSIFKNLEMPAERSNRFALYSSIYNNVQICKRVIAVYLSNCFLRNTISNKPYTIQSVNEGDNTRKEQDTAFIDSVLTKYDILPRIKEATKEMLIYGESYIEIVDLDDVKVNMPINTETSKKTKVITEDHAKLVLSRIKSKKAASESDCDLLIDLFTEIYDDTEYVTEGTKSDNTSNPLDRILLRFHSPKKVMKLESEFGVCLGYLEFNEKESANIAATGAMNITAQFMQTINVIGGGLNHSKKNKKLTVTTHDLANSIIKKIFQKYNITKSKYGDEAKNQKDYLDAIDSKIKPDLMHAIKKTLMSGSKLSVRYIKPDKCIQMKYTNGVSVIDTLVYPAKLYLLIQLTNVISRMSRSAAVRKWSVNIGSRENASSVIRKLRDSLRNQRITASDMMSKDVSKIMTDFRDLITVQKNGNSYLDVDMMNLGDPSVSTQDLEFQRNEMVAVSGIPASYLGYNDNYELRDQLVHANISFANEILSVQDNVNNTVNELINEIHSVLNNKHDALSVKFALTPPMVLMLQVIEVVMQSFNTIYSTLKDTMSLETDPIDLLNHFVPYANWAEIVRKGKSYKMKKDSSGTKDNNQSGF